MVRDFRTPVSYMKYFICVSLSELGMCYKVTECVFLFSNYLCNNTEMYALQFKCNLITVTDVKYITLLVL